MTETITLTAHGLHVALAAQPVTRQEYVAYSAASGQPMPAALARGGSPAAPVTYVSQVDAAAYCLWLGARQGRSCRLPIMAELYELADELNQEGITSEVWPHMYALRPQLRGGTQPTYLCEWTQETDELPQFGSSAPRRQLGSVFYPPWVRQGSNAAHAQAYLAATEGYSFITFRVAYAL